MVKKYITKEAFDSIAVIEDDMRQVFHHQFSRNVYKNEIIKMKQEGSITEEDLKVAKLLFRFRFSTLEQLHEAIGTEKEVHSFYGRLEKLLQYRIINKFMLSNYEEDRLYHDAQQFYCLDIGGQYLLTHFSNEEDILDWFYIQSIATSEIIAQSLMTFDFYNAFMRTCPDKIAYFRPNPALRVGTKTLVPAFEMALNLNNRTIYFLGEVIRKQEVGTVFRHNTKKWNQLINTNTWRKYYGQDNDMPPVILAMTADDVSAFQVSRILHESGEIAQFRVTTEERIDMPLYEAGAFLMYTPGQQQMVQRRIQYFEPEHITRQRLAAKEKMEQEQLQNHSTPKPFS